jgi:hypothetical protein
MKYKLKIQGLHTPPGTISIRALKELVDAVIESSERVSDWPYRVKVLSGAHSLPG